MEDTIQALILSAAVGEGWRAEFARRWSLLPVYQDMGGVLALDDQGEVYSWGHESLLSPEPVVLEGLRRLALSRASSEFPELASLAPVRPTDAVDCDSCGGLGRVLAGETSFVCSDWYGLGWHAA